MKALASINTRSTHVIFYQITVGQQNDIRNCCVVGVKMTSNCLWCSCQTWKSVTCNYQNSKLHATEKMTTECKNSCGHLFQSFVRKHMSNANSSKMQSAFWLLNAHMFKILQCPNCVPELGWQKCPFAQMPDVALAQCIMMLCHSSAVCRKLSDGRSLVRTSTVKQSLRSEPSTLAGDKQALNARRHSALTPCESCPERSTRSAAVKVSTSAVFAWSKRKIPTHDQRHAHAVWPTECGVLRLLRLLRLRWQSFCAESVRFIDKEPHRNTVWSAPTILPHTPCVQMSPSQVTRPNCSSVAHLSTTVSWIVGERKGSSLCTMNSERAGEAATNAQWNSGWNCRKSHCTKKTHPPHPKHQQFW